MKKWDAWGVDPRSVVQVELRAFVGAPVSGFSFLPWDFRDRNTAVSALQYGTFRPKIRARRAGADR